MHAQVVTFGLNGISEEQFHEAVGPDTKLFANLPGLLAKIWLRDPESNTYGGLYIWADQEAYERYIKGEVFNAIKADQNLKNVESCDFGVFEDYPHSPCRDCARCKHDRRAMSGAAAATTASVRSHFHSQF